LYQLEPQHKLYVLEFLCYQLLASSSVITDAVKTSSDEVSALRAKWRDSAQQKNVEARDRRKFHFEINNTIKAKYDERLKAATEEEYEEPKDRKEKIDGLKEQKRKEVKDEDDRHNAAEEASALDHATKFSEYRNDIRQKFLILRTAPFGKDRYRRRYYAYQSIRGLVVEPYISSKDEYPYSENEDESVAGSEGEGEDVGGDDNAQGVASSESAGAAGAADTQAAPASQSALEVDVDSKPNAAVKTEPGARSLPAPAKAPPREEDPMAGILEPELAPPSEWQRYTSADQLDVLINSLSERGVRERDLRSSLEVFRGVIESSMVVPKTPARRAKKPSKPPREADSIVNKIAKSLQLDILKLEQRLNDGALSIIPDRDGWGARVETSITPQELADCVLELEASVESRYLHSPPAKDVDEDLVELEHFYLGKPGGPVLDTPLQTPVKKAPEPEPEVDAGEASIASEDKAPQVPKKSNLQRWREMTSSCSSFAQVFISVGILDQSVDWSKSVLRAKCKTCKKSGDAEKLLLCDKCDKGYHMYCLKPPLKRVPKGDWFCADCAKRMTAKEKRKRALAKEKAKEAAGAEGEAVDSDDDDDADVPLGGKKKRAKTTAEPDEDAVASKKGKAVGGQGRGKRKRASAVVFPTPDDDDEGVPEVVVKAPKEKKKVGRPRKEKKEDAGSTAKATADENDENCSACGKFGELICCETCPKAFHLHCTGQKRVPRGDWHCKSCRELLGEDLPGNHTTAEKTNTAQRRRNPPSMDLALEIVKDLQIHRDAGFFLKPVSKKEAPDYSTIVKRPMDLQTIRSKLEALGYETLDDVLADVDQIFTNARLYNDLKSPVVADADSCATHIERQYGKRIKAASKEKAKEKAASGRGRKKSKA